MYELDKSVKKKRNPLSADKIYQMRVQVGRCYLLGEVVILVMRHARGDVVNDLGGGGGIIRCRLTRAAISLQPSHEATVSCEVHLHDHVSTETAV